MLNLLFADEYDTYWQILNASNFVVHLYISYLIYFHKPILSLVSYFHSWYNRVVEKLWKLIRNFIRIVSGGLDLKPNLLEFTVTLGHTICHLQKTRRKYYFLNVSELWWDKCFRLVMIGEVSLPSQKSMWSYDFQKDYVRVYKYSYNTSGLFFRYVILYSWSYDIIYNE